MQKQHTISKEVSISGVGIHTGEEINLKFMPAAEDTGIVFVRTDLPQRISVKADVSNIIGLEFSPRRTSAAKDGAEVHTIEHLMAALSASSIDNLSVELDGPELPALDGSSAEFVRILKEAGSKEQEGARKEIFLKEPLFVSDEGSCIIAVPAEHFKVSYTLNYNHPLMRGQFCEFSSDFENFNKEIAPARTFCVADEAETLKSQGMGKGADYSNTLVVGDNGVIKNKLRFEDEFARHKVLDIIGDFYLLGGELKAHIIALKSGHSLNIKLLRKIALSQKKVSDEKINRDASIKPVSAVEIEPGKWLDIEGIKKILPHREPFLFVDRIVEIEKDKRIVGVKNVTINDYFFKGHFPRRPIMPGVIIVEAMAQTAGILMLSKEENAGKFAYFMGINNVKFRKAVVPGDQLFMEIEVLRLKSKTGVCKAKALVDGKVVAEADISFALV